MSNLAIKQVPVNEAIGFLVSKDNLLKALKFVESGISNEETRYYLNGVYFDKQKDKPLYLVTTDGHRLHKIVLEGCAVDAEFNCILSKTMLPVLKAILKTAGKNDDISIIFTPGGLGKLTIFSHDCALVDGEFPDYQRVIPACNDRAALAGYNAKYLVDVFSSFASLKTGKYGLAAVETFGGGTMADPIKFKCEGEDALIVLMPVRV